MSDWRELVRVAIIETINDASWLQFENTKKLVEDEFRARSVKIPGYADNGHSAGETAHAGPVLHADKQRTPVPEPGRDLDWSVSGLFRGNRATSGTAIARSVYEHH